MDPRYTPVTDLPNSSLRVALNKAFKLRTGACKLATAEIVNDGDYD